jgi:hypothetical protein
MAARLAHCAAEVGAPSPWQGRMCVFAPSRTELETRGGSDNQF